MSPSDLVQKCNEAMRLGVDFPTLWHTIIKPDPDVIGPPVQRLDGSRIGQPALMGNLIINNILQGATVPILYVREHV